MLHCHYKRSIQNVAYPIVALQRGTGIQRDACDRKRLPQALVPTTPEGNGHSGFTALTYETGCFRC
ncbi:MAG: hypothetical protein HW384_1599 [Dehalococcoidia bacterium]|nr:hypothetical protein [Dehalococcoidia bacterium]